MNEAQPALRYNGRKRVTYQSPITRGYLTITLLLYSVASAKGPDLLFVGTSHPTVAHWPSLGYSATVTDRNSQMAITHLEPEKDSVKIIPRLVVLDYFRNCSQ